eukprot:PhM_4_TR9003/c0_g1_i1/m.2365
MQSATTQPYDDADANADMAMLGQCPAPNMLSPHHVLTAYVLTCADASRTEAMATPEELHIMWLSNPDFADLRADIGAEYREACLNTIPGITYFFNTVVKSIVEVGALASHWVYYLARLSELWDIAGFEEQMVLAQSLPDEFPEEMVSGGVQGNVQQQQHGRPRHLDALLDTVPLKYSRANQTLGGDFHVTQAASLLHMASGYLELHCLGRARECVDTAMYLSRERGSSTTLLYAKLMESDVLRASGSLSAALDAAMTALEVSQRGAHVVAGLVQVASLCHFHNVALPTEGRLPFDALHNSTHISRSAATSKTAAAARPTKNTADTADVVFDGQGTGQLWCLALRAAKHHYTHWTSCPAPVVAMMHILSLCEPGRFSSAIAIKSYVHTLLRHAPMPPPAAAALRCFAARRLLSHHDWDGAGNMLLPCITSKDVPVPYEADATALYLAAERLYRLGWVRIAQCLLERVLAILAPRCLTNSTEHVFSVEAHALYVDVLLALGLPGQALQCVEDVEVGVVQHFQLGHTYVAKWRLQRARVYLASASQEAAIESLNSVMATYGEGEVNASHDGYDVVIEARLLLQALVKDDATTKNGRHYSTDSAPCSDRLRALQATLTGAYDTAHKLYKKIGWLREACMCAVVSDQTTNTSTNNKSDETIQSYATRATAELTERGAVTALNALSPETATSAQWLACAALKQQQQQSSSSLS